MELHDVFHFGKHSGKTLKDTWCGQFDKIDYEVVNRYLKDFIDFTLGKREFNYKVLSNGYDLSESDLEFLSKNDLEIWEKSKFKLANNIISIEILDKEFRMKLISFLLNHFNYNHFSEPFFKGYKHPENHSVKVEFSKGSEILALMIPDPDYIRWCMKELSDFYISQDNIQLLRTLKSVYPFIKLKQIDDQKLEYHLYSFQKQNII